MRILFTRSTHQVDAGHALSGIARRAQTLRVASGKVWITIEGLPQDHWLAAGDSLVVVPGRLIVVEADRVESRIELPCLAGKKRGQPAAASGLRSLVPWLIGNKIRTG